LWKRKAVPDFIVRYSMGAQCCAMMRHSPTLQLSILAIPAILAIYSATLCRRFSASPPPGVELLLQTKGKVHFDRAVTERSKLFFGVILPWI
jgi:hypothetical protein